MRTVASHFKLNAQSHLFELNQMQQGKILLKY